jgi:small subunit ribosomal protein S14
MLKKLLHKDKKTRRGFKKSEIYSLLNKSFKKTSKIYNVHQPEIFLFKNIQKSKTKIRNRCIYSSRGRGIISRFKMSRMFFRKMAGQGYLPGIYKK